MISNYTCSVPNYVVGPNYPTVSQKGLPGLKASPPEVVNENQSS